MSDATGNDIPTEEKQCRICLDGSEAERELGRLIRPCLCKGSISYVHVKCLQKWRNTSSSTSAFFSCPQCHYQYRFARTRIVGLASNPVLVGGLSGFFFTILVVLASYITTYFMGAFEEPTTSSYYSWTFFYVSPLEVAQDLVVAALRILKDGGIDGLLDDTISSSRNGPRGRRTDDRPLRPPPNPGFVKRFIKRFLLGLPLVSAGSLVHMLLSVGYLVPVQWLARYRGNRNRRDGSRDLAALIVVALLALGALRALLKVYQLTHSVTQRLLLRAEDAILEVA
ncbi:E3 ubiquitin-protein ligase MARCH5 [Leucoagaricus sp. SymC.cos]|nr:E3 ubiquitin-protein ligase MARCH5 [Leucoagaricus sp. SymC.cos]